MATTMAGKKALMEKAPKIQENRKKSLFIKGRKVTQELNQVWNELAIFRMNEIVKYSQKNPIQPFDSLDEIQKMCQKEDCSLFTFFNSNKKRKDDIIFGRLFDGNVMEMYEFGVNNYIGRPNLPGADISFGALTSLIFQGDEWDLELSHLRSFFMDFFVGDMPKDSIELEQLQHVVVLTYIESKILFRHYLVQDNHGVPNLVQCSPSFELERRREMKPDEELFAQALEKPQGEKKKKNITKDDLGREIGRVFVPKAKLGNVGLTHFKGLPKRNASAD